MLNIARFRSFPPAILSSIVAIVASVGCASDQRSGPTINPLRLMRPERGLTPDELQRRLMQFTDTFLARIQEATYALVTADPAPRRRVEALRAKIGPATALLSLAADDKPDDALLDMLALVSLQRRVAEEGWAERTFGDQASLLIDAWRELDDELWRIAREVLNDEQVDELQNLIAEWRRANPDRIIVAAVRFEDFEKLRKSDAGANPFERGLQLLNPLTDTAQAVDETRRFADRARFVMQRMPLVLTWHAEYLAYEFAAEPEAQQALANLDTLTKTAQRYADAFDSLQQTLGSEREAAMRQLSDELARQRNELLDELERRRTELNDSLDQVRETTEAAKSLAAEVRLTVDATDRALKTLDAIVHPPTASQPGAAPPPSVGAPRPHSAEGAPPAKPFDIEEYRRAVEELRHTLVEAQQTMKTGDELLKSRAWDERLADVDRLVAQRTEQVIGGAWRILITAAIATPLLVIATSLILRVIRGRRS